MKNRKFFAKVLCGLLAVMMLVSALPISFSVAAAGDTFTNAQLSVITEKASTLAPGVTQDAYTVYNNNNEQVKMWVTKADTSVDTVNLYASYQNMDPTVYGMSRLTAQVESFNEKVAAGDEYYQGTVVAGINSSYYNMTTGKPTGAFVMNGVDVTTEAEGNAYGYFAVMKDGSVKIGNKGDYSSDKGNIQEAIGIYTMLIVDGKICSGLDTTKYYPRQTIGITADGEVIIMTADGNQAPKSIGLTVQEQAQVMLDLGCVWAGHLDGGGSCTYAAMEEGTNNFGIVNSPSDGSERKISNGFIIASTVVSDGKFASAALSADNTYVAPGSTVAISATGLDAASGPAEIPADISWQMADTSFGTVENGVFTSNGKVGDAVVQMVYNGNVVGEITIHVVIPDSVSFSSTEFVVPYTKSISLEVEATYGVRNVYVKPSDFDFAFSNSAVGTMDGFTFTACDDSTVTTSSVTATFKYDTSLVASANITLGRGSEVVYDFEDGTSGTLIFDEAPGTKYNYVWAETEQSVVDETTGKVHSGDKALAMNVDYSNNLESGYMKTSLYSTEAKTFDNAVSVGTWIYIPDECDALWVRWTLLAVNGYNDDGTPVWGSSVNGNTMDTTAGGTGVVYTFDEPGWHYLSVDTSAYASVGWSANRSILQFYISDRDGTAYEYYAAETSNIPSKYQFYIDDITVDYSTAVDDREAPVLSNVTYAVEGMADAAALDGNTVTNNVVTFAASVADYTGKTNYSGIDASTVKAYIDGVEVESSYSNGKVAINDAKLANGKHTIKFAASDNMGNYGYVYADIIVDAEESVSTVKLVAQNPDADRILLGSIYNMELVATDIEEVQNVEVTVDLDNTNTWQLDHMTPAAGFDVSYTLDTTDNIATITVTRTGENTQTGEASLVTIPVRVYQLETGYTYPNGTKEGAAALTMKQFRDNKEFWRISVIANVDKGVLTRVDGTTDTFTGERVFCDTEMWANYSNMVATTEGLAYYNAWDGGHLHTEAAIDDVAATCTTDGYTGRTFCSVCNSVVDWGTTVEAKGHTYTVVDGVLQCEADGVLFNGIYTDGKTYVDGLVIADGWTEDYAYYKDGVKLTGLQVIDGYYYDFGTEGICANKARLDGFYYDEAEGAYMYFTAGLMATGDVAIYPTVYFFDENGYAISGEVNVNGYDCIFDEKGAYVSSSDATVVDAGFSGTNIEYVLLSDGTLKVGGEGVMKDYTANGLYPAWVIKNETTSITAIEIGNGITHIGKFGFFKNGYVRSLTFEENSSLKSIGWGGFGHCWRITEVTIPASVETLEEYAFYECGALKTVNFEEGSQLKTIKEYAFMHDIGLETVYIPDSVETMGVGVFIKAKADVVLQVVEYSVAHNYAIANGHNVELREGYVPPIASGNVTDTVTWTLQPNGTLEIAGTGAMADYTNYAQQPWANYRHLIKSVVIGKDITTVGNYAFAYSQYIESVEFEEGSKLTSVGVLAFMNVPKVKEITLPDTVTYIGSYAFADCFALENIYIPQGMEYIYATAFNNSSLAVLNVADGTYAEEFAVAQNLNYVARDFVYIAIDGGALSDTVNWEFYENGELRITGEGAMPNFTSHAQQPWNNFRHKLKKVVIGKDITTVGNYAFCYAQNITEVEFEEGSELTTVGVLSFFNVPKVKAVTLPDTVTFISSYAFGDCFALESLYVPQGVNYIYNTAFTNSDALVLNVAEGTYAHEFAVAQGVDYEVRDFVYVAIDGGALNDTVNWEFYENGELRITGEGAMPNFTSHAQQPWNDFRHKLKKIVIGKDITTVGNYAFCYAQNVTSIVFEEGSELTSVGVLSFFNVPKVAAVTLPDTVTSISSYAFGDCFALADVYVPQGVSYIYNTAFTNSGLVVLNVAEGTYAEEYAQKQGINYETRDFVYVAIDGGALSDTVNWEFYENGELRITGEGDMPNFTSHSQQPWMNIRHKFKKLVVGKDITAIGNYTFAYCNSIESIEFEEGSKLVNIGVLAFMNNAKVTEITLPETVKYIGSYAFGDCFNLTNVYVPDGTDNIYSTAFTNSKLVVLNVAEGSVAENFAKAYNISYTTR